MDGATRPKSHKWMKSH